MNPIWNTLIVAGIEDEEKNNKETSSPFIGVITQKVQILFYAGDYILLPRKLISDCSRELRIRQSMSLPA